MDYCSTHTEGQTPHTENPTALQNKWPISAPVWFRGTGCMLAVTSSARPGLHRSNTGMIYVPCLGPHTACSSAVELSVEFNSSSNLSPYVWEERSGGQWNENDQTLLNCCIYFWFATDRLSICQFVHLSCLCLGAVFHVRVLRPSGCSQPLGELI